MSTNSIPAFKQAQYQFAAHLRNPDHNPAPTEIEDRRMKIYRDLFINNVSGLLAQTFPVFHEIMGEQRWAGLMREFYANYQCKTPLFSELAKEFLDWLSQARPKQADDLPFMVELAHYEWVELALSLAADAELEVELHRYGDLLNCAPVLSPLAWPLAYQFPVHQISPDFQPQEATEPATCLVVYRDRDDQVGFIETNPITTQLLMLLENNQHEARSGQAILDEIAEQWPNIPKQAIIDGGLQTLEQLRQKDIVLGTIA